MDGETFHIPPNVVVIFGVRSVLSMIGLTIAFVGYWLMERRWDNQGSAALQRPQPEEKEGGGGGNVELPAPPSKGNNIRNNSIPFDEDKYVALPDPPTKADADATTPPKESESDFCGGMLATNEVLCGQLFHNDGCRDLVRVSTADSYDKTYHPPKAAAATNDPEGLSSAVAIQYYDGTPQLLQNKLNAALPVPTVMLVGFVIWGISFLFDPTIGGARVYGNGFWNVACFALAALLGLVLAFPIRSAILERDADHKKRAQISFVVLLGLLGLLSLADTLLYNKKVWYINILAVSFILCSHPLLSRSRKMGLTWDSQGKAKSNTEIYIQNLGTPMLILGIFLLWIGTNVVSVLAADLQQSYLPLWTTNSRSWCVFISGMVVIVPALLALDLAFDHGSQLVPVQTLFGLVFYKLDGNTFVELVSSTSMVKLFPAQLAGTLFETPFYLSCGWILMALSAFLPFGVTDLTVQKFCAMAACLLLAPIYSVFFLPSLWKAELLDFSKWSFAYYVLIILWATAIGIRGGIALLLSMLGVGFVVIGQRLDLYERKRGITWLNKDVSPETASPTSLITPLVNPEVFGYGQPIHIVGWIMLCLAMSVPM